MYKNIFYFSYLNRIGGIEQFFAYLTEKYKDWDITIVYKLGDPQQINRLRKYARVIKFEGQQFTCEKAFFCFNTDIKSHVKANKYALILHGDYKAMVEQQQLSKNCYIFSEQFDEYYGVSQLVCDSWKELTGNDCKLIYNPFIQQEKKKILKIVYCGRLTPEKGGKLAHKLLNRLDELCIDYFFYVYSDKREFKGDKVINMDTRLDACQFLNSDNFDYILVPSYNEGYCYSLVQALANGLPAIITPCPVFKEIGANKHNSIELAFDGSNIDDCIFAMLKNTFDFTYIPKDDTWNKVLAKGKTTYDYKCVTIKAISDYLDVELCKPIKKGMTYEVSNERAKVIVGAGFAQYMEEK